MPESDGRDLSLVFLIDALGHEIVGRGGFLDRLVGPERPRLRSILGYSSAAIPSLITGLPPDAHGHWGMYKRDGGSSVFGPYRHRLALAGLLPRGRWRVRRWLAGRLRRNGVSGYFSLYEVPLDLLPRFDLTERRNIYRPGGFDSAESLFDSLARAGIPHRVWDWSVPEDRAFAEMEGAARQGGERLLFLYTPGLDAVMHVHGPGTPAAAAWLTSAEEKIERIVGAARAAGRKPRLRIFGDHGMAAVRAHRDVAAELRGLPVRAPRDYLFFLDSTMARFWFHDDRARDLVMSRMREGDGGRFIGREELTREGVDFADRAYGEEIYLCNPGWLILPSFMGSSPVRGMHGYHPDDADSYSTLLADPAPARPPSSILDIRALLLSDLAVGGPD